MEIAKYLVPYDFTEAAQIALNYAIHIGKITGAKIYLTNIVTDQSDVEKVGKKLDKVIEQLEKTDLIAFEKVVKVGVLFHDINKVAIKYGIQLIFMGTHGAKGLQKLFGSFAMKVITSSKLPFFIVQKETKIIDIKHILVSIDATSESLQITGVAADLGNIVGAEITIAHETPRDSLFKNKFNIHYNVIEKSYANKQMKYAINVFKESGGASYKKILDFAKKNHCELISIAYFSDAIFPQFDTFAQNLIMNEDHLPCLIVNAIPTSNAFYK